MSDLRATLDTHLGDRYEVLHELGSGGMAKVFLARDAKHGREVALKVLRPEVAQALGTERFLREIETVARLTHPHILPLHDSGEADGLLYYVMPYVKGDSLEQRLEREGALPVDEALRIAADCAEALEHAHGRGVVHRDLKPANILFSGGQPVVADFARATETESAPALTRPGVSLGTVGYMSPEQASGEESVDARSDVYSLGCVLFEMLTGERAFSGRTAHAVMARQVTERPPTAPMLRAGIPERLDEVLRRALQPRPSDRYRTAAEFRAALEPPAHGDEVDTRSATTVRGWRSGVGGLAALVLGALALVVWNDAREVGGEADAPRIRSLAVLPLDNHSAEAEAEPWFADGMTEALTTELGGIGTLRVISSGSARRFKESGLPSSEIARELQVDALVDGSVLQANNRIRVDLRLLEGATSEVLWTESYEQDVRNILALFGDISRAVAEEIQVAVTPDEAAGVASARTVDPEAYTAWLKGNFHQRRMDEASLRRALAYYRDALTMDPDFAPAHAAIAWTHTDLGGWFGSDTPEAAMPRAREAAERALTLDSTVAEAHVALGAIRFWFEWDWEGAERAYRRALALDPTSGATHVAYAHFLDVVGRSERAVEIGRRAIEIDPLYPSAYFQLGTSLELLGRDPEALDVYREGLEIAPRHIQGNQLIAEFHYARLGAFEEALSHLAESRRGGGDRWNEGVYGYDVPPDAIPRPMLVLQPLGDPGAQAS